jgi:hypothetical protein
MGVLFSMTIIPPCSASARISKGQGYQGFFKEKGKEQFWPKKGNLCRTKKNLKNGQISLLLGSIKCFPISFSTFKTL